MAGFSNSISEILSIIERREYEKLRSQSLEVPGKFNWIRDVFEPLIVAPNAELSMLELVTEEGRSDTVSYQEGMLKCNQLLELSAQTKVHRETACLLCVDCTRVYGRVICSY